MTNENIKEIKDIIFSSFSNNNEIPYDIETSIDSDVLIIHCVIPVKIEDKRTTSTIRIGINNYINFDITELKPQIEKLISTNISKYTEMFGEFQKIEKGYRFWILT